MGYLGGLVALALCYPFLRGGFEMENVAGLRQSFLVVAAFFAVAGLPALIFVRERARGSPLPPGSSYLRAGYRRVLETMREAQRYRELMKFFAVFFLYNCGIVTVVVFAAVYAEQVIRMKMMELIVFFLQVQVTSATGAFVFGLVHDRLGARLTINLTLILWMAVSVLAYLSTGTATFYVAGNLAGLAIGATQSSSRALVALLSPVGRTAEFFGFWGLFWKLSNAIGPFVFGWITLLTGSLRTAVLATGMFFLAGFVGMFTVDERAGRRAAAEQEMLSPSVRGASR